MRVCIISGTYNPGKCGISDYIHLLSEKLCNLGHEVSHASVHHLAKSNDFIQNYPNHDLYSIQFAPYAFSSNGVLNKSILKIAKSLNSQKTHINFHEIWIGAYPKASFKERLTGWRQKFKILTFFNNLNPNFITSTNAAAIDRLAIAGIRSGLPIFIWKHTTVATYNLDEKNHATSQYLEPLMLIFLIIYWLIKQRTFRIFKLTDQYSYNWHTARNKRSQSH